MSVVKIIYKDRDGNPICFACAVMEVVCLQCGNKQLIECVSQHILDDSDAEFHMTYTCTICGETIA